MKAKLRIAFIGYSEFLGQSLDDIGCAQKDGHDGSRAVVRWWKVIPTVCAVMTISPEDRKYLEEMGELYVRQAMHMIDTVPFPFGNSAREWLAELDETQRQMREARHAKEAAEQSERTVRAAWITAFAVILALLVSILAWIFPLH